MPVKQATLPDVIFGDGIARYPSYCCRRLADDTAPGIDGIVGIAALQARRVHFDFSSKTLSWE